MTVSAKPIRTCASQTAREIQPMQRLWYQRDRKTKLQPLSSNITVRKEQIEASQVFKC